MKRITSLCSRVRAALQWYSNRPELQNGPSGGVPIAMESPMK